MEKGINYQMIIHVTDYQIIIDFEKFIFIDKYGNYDLNIDKSFNVKELSNTNKKT